MISIKPDKITDLDWKIIKNKYPDNLKEVIEKIKNNYPVQYIIGNVEFCDAVIEVNEHVLIPRFETEYLVEKLFNRLKEYPSNTLNIIDIGTGSGCIIISLAQKLKQNFVGVDISKEALELASKNAKANNVQINFKQLNILKEKSINDYDIIISNPPYVSFNEFVDPCTKYEPQNAIFANNDGLEFYEKILDIITNKPKLIAFEIGMNQGEKIALIAKKKFPKAKISIEKDLTGKDRYIFIEDI